MHLLFCTLHTRTSLSHTSSARVSTQQPCDTPSKSFRAVASWASWWGFRGQCVVVHIYQHKALVLFPRHLRPTQTSCSHLRLSLSSHDLLSPRSPSKLLCFSIPIRPMLCAEALLCSLDPVCPLLGLHILSSFLFASRLLHCNIPHLGLTGAMNRCILGAECAGIQKHCRVDTLAFLAGSRLDREGRLLSE